MCKILKINCLILITLVLINGCAALEKRRLDEKAALDETTTWLKYLDERDYDKLWEISSDLRKLKTTKEDFIRITRGIRKPLGKVIERDLVDNVYIAFIKHYPNGDYRRVGYWSEYENKDFVREYILLVKENDRWKMLDYHFI